MALGARPEIPPALAARRRWAARFRRVRTAWRLRRRGPPSNLDRCCDPRRRGAVEFLIQIASAFAVRIFSSAAGAGASAPPPSPLSSSLPPATLRKALSKAARWRSSFFRSRRFAAALRSQCRGGLRIIGTASASLAVARQSSTALAKAEISALRLRRRSCCRRVFSSAAARHIARTLAASVFTAIRYAPERLREADLRGLPRNARKVLCQGRPCFLRIDTILPYARGSQRRHVDMAGIDRLPARFQRGGFQRLPLALFDLIQRPRTAPYIGEL